jgi:hypothetical protein
MPLDARNHRLHSTVRELRRVLYLRHLFLLGSDRRDRNDEERVHLSVSLLEAGKLLYRVETNCREYLAGSDGVKASKLRYIPECIVGKNCRNLGTTILLSLLTGASITESY